MEIEQSRAVTYVIKTEKCVFGLMTLMRLFFNFLFPFMTDNNSPFFSRGNSSFTPYRDFSSS